MLLYDKRQEVLATAHQLVKSGLVAATWGNVSARDPETDLIAIIPLEHALQDFDRRGRCGHRPTRPVARWQVQTLRILANLFKAL